MRRAKPPARTRPTVGGISICVMAGLVPAIHVFSL
jgi:hypothetical protein